MRDFYFQTSVAAGKFVHVNGVEYCRNVWINERTINPNVWLVALEPQNELQTVKKLYKRNDPGIMSRNLKSRSNEENYYMI